MLREAEPYDFGGIDIIDELPLPTARSAGEGDEDAEAEGATQSAVPEPSLTNVVTAAEDFIKVLATVSGSTADSDKESQGSAKNKKKSGGKKKARKKTGKKRKGKGKWSRRKQKAEGAAVPSTPGGGAEDVKALSNFISESQREKAEVADRGGGGHELGEEEKPSNQVMKDEPAAENETASASPTEQEKPELVVSTTVTPKQWRRGWRSRGKAGLPPHGNATDASPPATAGARERLGSEPDGEKVKQRRSKERRVKDGGKKRRKDGGGGGGGAPPTAPSDEGFSVAYLESIPLTGTPTVVTLSHRQDAHRGTQSARGRGGGGARHSSLSRTEARKSQKKRLKGSEARKEPSLPPSTESSSPTTETVATERRPDATATPAPSVTAETQIVEKQRRKGRKKKKKDNPSTASTAAVPLQHFRQTPLTEEIYTTYGTPDATTSATPTMSPRQLSIERVRAHFGRKKRRKAMLSRRQS